MLNKNLYRACKNGQQRLIGMRDIMVDTTTNDFSSLIVDLTNDIESFISVFLAWDKYWRIEVMMNKIFIENYDWLIGLNTCENPSGWENGMKYVLAGVFDGMSEIPGITVSDKYMKISYTDLTVTEWLNLIYEYTKEILDKRLLGEGE